MIRSLPLLLLLLVAACGGGVGVPERPATQINPDRTAEHVGAEPHALADAGATVQRDAAGLRLTLVNGTAKSYGPDHVLVRFVRSAGAFVIYRRASRDYLLVDDGTGAESALAAPPVLSPEGRRFLVLAVNHVRLGSVVQIWSRARGGSFAIEFSAAPLWTGDYLYYGLRRWTEEAVIELTAERRSPTDYTFRATDFEIRLRRGNWVVDAQR